MGLRTVFITCILLVGCAPPTPDSGRGVGFGDNPRAADLRENRPSATAPLVPGQAISGERVNSNMSGSSANNGTPINLNNPGISDEQDFGAVTARETIESDAQRREAQKQAYRVISPTALPTRPGSDGASIVAFALSTTNRVGQSLYRRSGVMAKGRFERNCAKFPSSDRAQEAFLEAGGPKRDRKGLDPDGDGFACFWDPSPYRLARGG